METALWEDDFRGIEKGAVKPQQFVAGISQTIGQHLNTSRHAILDEAMKPTAAQCPSGKGPLLHSWFVQRGDGLILRTLSPNFALTPKFATLPVSSRLLEERQNLRPA